MSGGWPIVAQLLWSMWKGKAAQRLLIVPKHTADLSQRLFSNVGPGAPLRDLETG